MHENKNICTFYYFIVFVYTGTNLNQINFLETYIPVFSFRISNSQKIGLTEEVHVKICDIKATNVVKVHYFQLFQILMMLGL